jgi:adenylate kinase family enzyme
VAEKYKLVNVRVSQLITDAIRRLEPDVDAVKELRYLQETQDFHSDRITELVLDRLRKPDCRINGWVLDGCPFTLAQIKDLKDEKVTPQLVIALELNDKRLEERLKQYYYDPITHFMYFSEQEIYELDSESQKRLEEHGEESEDIAEKLNQYRDFLTATEEEFLGQFVRVNGDDYEDRVLGNFCNAIEGSI